MARTSTEDLLQTGFEHLGRFAFYTRENPFLSSWAVLTPAARQRQLLTELLAGGRRARHWLKSPRRAGFGHVPVEASGSNTRISNFRAGPLPAF